MPKTSLSELKPGMYLSKPVLNNSGMVLLSEYTMLTESVIERLNNMNIEFVYVKGVSKPVKPKEEALLELHRIFEKVEHLPYMGMLKKVVEEHIEELYE